MNITPKAVDLNKRIDSFLKEYFPSTSISAIQKLLRKNLIKINEKKTIFSYKLKKGDEINIKDFIYQNLINNEKSTKKSVVNTKKAKKKIFSKEQINSFLKTIIYKDEDIIAINKPYDLAVQSGSKTNISVDDFLDYLKFDKSEKPRLVHRLDKHTTGVLLIARNKLSSENLTQFFKKKDSLAKIYLALIVGIPTKKSGTISIPLSKKYEGSVEKVYKDEKEGKEAITKYKVIAESVKKNISLVELQIITGRTHQIRVHMKELGYPILGDGKYGGKKAFIDDFEDKLHLHSYRIKIDNRLNIRAELPEHIRKALKNNSDFKKAYATISSDI